MKYDKRKSAFVMLVLWEPREGKQRIYKMKKNFAIKA